MATFRVAEDSRGTSEDEWLGAFGRRDVPLLRLERTWQEAVVVSAHPDDDVLGVGDLLRALRTDGLSIHSIVATDGERSAPESAFGSPDVLGALRRAELRRAYERLGIVPSVNWLAIPDGEVARHEAEVTSRLHDVIAADTLVLVPWRLDGHPDHDAVGRAAAAAVAQARATLWEFPVWAWHWADPEADDFPWSRALRWSCGDVIAKREAIDCFDTQVRPVEASVGEEPVLPVNVLERFHRPFEVVFT